MGLPHPADWVFVDASFATFRESEDAILVATVAVPTGDLEYAKKCRAGRVENDQEIDPERSTWSPSTHELASVINSERRMGNMGRNAAMPRMAKILSQVGVTWGSRKNPLDRMDSTNTRRRNRGGGRIFVQLMERWAKKPIPVDRWQELRSYLEGRVVFAMQVRVAQWIIYNVRPILCTIISTTARSRSDGPMYEPCCMRSLGEWYTAISRLPPAVIGGKNIPIDNERRYNNPEQQKWLDVVMTACTYTTLDARR